MYYIENEKTKDIIAKIFFNIQANRFVYDDSNKSLEKIFDIVSLWIGKIAIENVSDIKKEKINAIWTTIENGDYNIYDQLKCNNELKEIIAKLYFNIEACRFAYEDPNRSFEKMFDVVTVWISRLVAGNESEIDKDEINYIWFLLGKVNYNIYEKLEFIDEINECLRQLLELLNNRSL